MTGSVLHVSAAAPDPDSLGGVAIHVAALARHTPRDIMVHTVHPGAGALLVQRWNRGATLEAVVSGSPDAMALEHGLIVAIAGSGARVLHVHSPMLGAEALSRAARATGARVIVSLHDGALVSENHELLEGGERYCGIPDDLARCDACLKATLGRPKGSVIEWRRGMAELVAVTDVFVAPSESALANVAKVHPNVRSRARLIPWGVPPPRARSTISAAGRGPLRVAVIGVWAKVKGTERLPPLLAACRDLNVEFHFFGATEGASLRAVKSSAARVVLHGAYRRPMLAERIVHAGCHIGLLSSVAAESFSLTLSEVTAVGLPVVASDLGALRERVQREQLGWLFDPWAPSTLRSILVEVEARRELVDETAARIRTRPVRTEEAMSQDHAELVRSLEELGPRGQGSLSQPDLSRFMAEYAAGVDRAAEQRPSLLGRAAHRIRKTDMYRDLRLRKILPESTRRNVERWAARLVSRTRSS